MVAPFLANCIRAVPCINPKHKGERHIKSEKDQIKVKNDRLRIKKSIKGRNNSDLEVSNQNSLSEIADLTGESWTWSLDSDKS